MGFGMKYMYVRGDRLAASAEESGRPLWCHCTRRPFARCSVGHVGDTFGSPVGKWAGCPCLSFVVVGHDEWRVCKSDGESVAHAPQPVGWPVVLANSRLVDRPVSDVVWSAT